ncbi:MAG TPA: 5'-3' exonuclease H3TH domain-containing protein, partial [Acidobacteriaceae bacterium]
MPDKNSKTTDPAQKPPVYLLDTMAFIFRAYHAMQRSRPMSTRTGIPTAATYVFVNMLNKLREDFNPVYLAAVYDVGRPVHRNELAGQMKDVQKFNIKTQQFETIEYGGYKANRTETPPDLIQQQPYIRRALEAFRIPIVFYEGFEADDVIGTLSCQLSALGHHVYVVSSDKDMMQLVNDSVSILNPTKDNLILDPAKVEENLGVPPEKVIDVMALRGDAIDNIPGAPGIGDKGSVELIQQFGTVEAAIVAATATPEAIKRKTYRESLAGNKDNILLSKELVTIHTSVPIEADLELMKTPPPDTEALRRLYTELEFTTLLKNLAPDVEEVVPEYVPRATEADLAALLREAREAGHLAIALKETSQAVSEEVAAEAGDAGADAEVEGVVEAEPEPAQTMSLFGGGMGFDEPGSATPDAGHTDSEQAGAACRIGLAVRPGLGIDVGLETAGLREALEDASLPKVVHDLKAVLRALEPQGVTLAGEITDVMLESYLVNPTHGSHTLVDIAARTTSRALVHQPTKENPADSKRLAEAAAAVARLAVALRKQMAEAST